MTESSNMLYLKDSLNKRKFVEYVYILHELQNAEALMQKNSSIIDCCVSEKYFAIFSAPFNLQNHFEVC